MTTPMTTSDAMQAAKWRALCKGVWQNPDTTNADDLIGRFYARPENAERATVATLRSTLEARDQRIAELTKLRDAAERRVEEVEDLGRYRNVVLSAAASYTAELRESLASRSQRIEELTGEVEGLRGAHA